ncbi:MerC domain-containing protein [Tenacibaculum sp. E3R01]|uniref:MerC domain-containing protein n=1 Tax=Tenacibaculum sp. E3R01 TaxID=2267227 RepID=UPI000DEADEC7|nr:MerC domain-containing protein [Tenacibaculum sp. E3R01]RBW58204.1 MerC domain-containing protein [Tenacibaculum sp. E3R01]
MTISKKIDLIGFLISLLCAIHCGILPILLTLAPFSGLAFMESPIVEALIVLVSLFIAILSLSQGFTKLHKKKTPLITAITGFTIIFICQIWANEQLETVLMVTGASTIALAHLINWKLCEIHHKKS